MDFNNKTIVITGGANGIGRCMVEEFAKNGANVAFIDVDKLNGDKLLLEIGSKHLFFHSDISKEKVLNEFVGAVVERYEGIDCLINNACISKRGIISNCSFDDFNNVLKIGVTAPYMLTKLFAPFFRKSASIVNISSTRSIMSQADTESYTAAKGGISALTHALAVSLAGKVRVNSISPGWIDTSNGNQSSNDKNQHLVGRVGTPMDIVKTAMFLCSDDSGFITGENITVDGGMTKLMIYHGDNGWKYNGI